MTTFSGVAVVGSRRRSRSGGARLNGSIWARRMGVSSETQRRTVLVGSVELEGAVRQATRERRSRTARIARKRGRKDRVIRDGGGGGEAEVEGRGWKIEEERVRGCW